MGLTQRQELIFSKMRKLPVPEAPALSPACLKDLPWSYRLIGSPFVLSGALLFAALFASFLWTWAAPVHWQGAAPFRTGASIRLEEGTGLDFRLPREEGFLTLQGPADLKVIRLGRRIITGRMEAVLKLNKGELLMDVSPKIPKQIFIHTPLLQARITGTRLLVSHRPEEASRVRVFHGTVFVRPAGGQKDWQPVAAGTEFAITVSGQALQSSSPAQGVETFTQAGKTEPVTLGPVLWHEEEM
jgi:hypothetical protein